MYICHFLFSCWSSAGRAWALVQRSGWRQRRPEPHHLFAIQTFDFMIFFIYFASKVLKTFVEQWSRDSCLGRLTWGIFKSPSSISPREEATRPPLSGHRNQQKFLMWRSCTKIQTLSYYLVRLICESTQGKKLEKIPFYFSLFILCLRPDLPEKSSFRVFLQRTRAATLLPDENEDKSIREEHRSAVFHLFFLHGNCLAHMTSPLQKKKKTIKVRVLLLQMQEGDLCL